MLQEKTLVLINTTELKSILLDFKGVTMSSMISLTPLEMKKFDEYWLVDENGKKKKNPNMVENPYFDKIFTYSERYKIVIGFDDYEDLVNKRRKNEGLPTDFVQQENWFERVENSRVLVTDKSTKSKFYLRYQYQKDSITNMEYRFEGNSIDKKLFESYMKEKTNYENQGGENTLNFQVCNLENILELTFNGTTYKVTH